MFGKKASERMLIRDHNRCKERIHAKRRKILFLVQRGMRGSEGVYSGTDKEGIYLTIKVTTNCTSVLCRKEGWDEENSIRLSVS